MQIGDCVVYHNESKSGWECMEDRDWQKEDNLVLGNIYVLQDVDGMDVVVNPRTEIAHRMEHFRLVDTVCAHIGCSSTFVNKQGFCEKHCG